MGKIYDCYREPCQLCIERAEQGQYDLVEGCGWCNDLDTHHRTTNEYPGDIIELPHAGGGYPYHKHPHPERKYFLNNRHLISLDGSCPDDGSEYKGSDHTSTSNEEGRPPPVLAIYAMVCAFIAALQNEFQYGVEKYFSILIRPFTLWRNDADNLVGYVMVLAMMFGIGWLIFSSSLKSKNDWPSIVFMFIFLGLPFYQFYK